MTGKRTLLLRRTAAVAASLLAGLVAAELAVGAVRGFAYPYLNVFSPDATYGVVLEPGSETRTRSRGGTLTEVRINAQGFRADAPFRPAPGPEPVAGRVLILGDSQVFGYGVPVEDAMAAQLEEMLRARGGPPPEVMSPAEVMSLGVPTWGPAEQVAILEELGPVLRPERVVFVANLANDWVEAHVENRRRHTARDGWARRVVSGAKAAPWSFPGRRWLLGRSHLALLTRQAGVALAGELPVAQAALRLAKEGAPVGEGGSVITPFVEQAAGWCRAHGCELVVAALPLDVQVHPGEWAKYRTPPADVSTGTALTAQLLSDLEARSVPAVDLLPPLRRASPGAFLDDDYHLSARGHRAVAEALLPRLVDSASDSASAGLRPGGPS